MTYRFLQVSTLPAHDSQANSPPSQILKLLLKDLVHAPGQTSCTPAQAGVSLTSFHPGYIQPLVPTQSSTFLSVSRCYVHIRHSIYKRSLNAQNAHHKNTKYIKYIKNLVALKMLTKPINPKNCLETRHRIYENNQLYQRIQEV